jgi:hypothetical protein
MCKYTDVQALYGRLVKSRVVVYEKNARITKRFCLHAWEVALKTWQITPKFSSKLFVTGHRI